MAVYFFADDHFGQHTGKNIFENLPAAVRERIVFAENDLEILESGKWLDDCELLVLNLIGGTCNVPHAGAGAEIALKKWCEKGGNILLLHGSSAAFWQWDWWRGIVGMRWVRPGDPDNVEKSTHPKKPYQLRVCKNRHPLSSRLVPFELDTDEIYIELEQVSPISILMDTFIEEGVYPQCFETVTPWNGKLVSFLPGHCPGAVANAGLLANIEEIIKYLL